MKPTTQIRLATRLFPHLEDLIGLKHLEPAEVLLLYNALTAWIALLQRQMIPPEQRETEIAHLFTSSRPCRYHLQDRFAAQTRLWVEEEGQPTRLLPHVPIFCPWGFGLDSLAARDTALAMLADHFGEPLSRRSFAQGQGQACLFYPVLAAYLHTRAPQGIIQTHEITALLLHCTQTQQALWELGERTFYPRPNGS